MSKSGPRIRTVVLDVLKPFHPILTDFTLFLADSKGVDKVDINVVEMNENTMSLRVTIDGLDIDFERLTEGMLKHNAIVKSIDRVVVEK